jgi:hypothetical protein
MRIRIKTLLKPSPAIVALLAMFAVALASQPLPPADATGAVCPPPGYNPGALTNLIQNESFEMVGPFGAQTSFTGIHGGGSSAVASWDVFHNTQGTTRTSHIPSNAPGGGAKMLHVYTTGANNGVVQKMGPNPNSGFPKVYASVWVFVQSGQVCLGTGNAGFTHCDATSTTLNQWVHLKACNGSSPANGVIIYSVGGPASFNVDLARVIRVE